MSIRHKKTEIIKFRATKRLKQGFEKYCDQNILDGPEWLRKQVRKLIGLKEGQS